MRKLTSEEQKRCKRDFKVLCISAAIYLAIVGLLSALLSFTSVSNYVAPLFFACMYIVDRKI